MRSPTGALLLCLVVLGPAVAAEELVVASAVSLREPMTEIGRAFEAERPGTRVRLTFGASSALAAQLRAGAPIDVIASADERILDALAAEGTVPDDGRAVLAGNRLVVIAADGIPLDEPDDLAGPDVRRIAVPEHAVPVGRYARAWLLRRGLLERVRPRLVATEHARATLAAVDAGHADAAIVYATDARLARRARVAFAVPESEHPRVVYAAARSTFSKQPEGAERFLAFLRGEAARAALAARGFAVGH